MGFRPISKFSPLSNPSKDVESHPEGVRSLIRIRSGCHHNLTADDELKRVAIRGFLKANRQSGVVFDLSSEPMQPRDNFTNKRDRRQEPDADTQT